MIDKYWPVFIVGLPTVNVMDTSLNKLDYITPYADCQHSKEKNTIDFNYITNEELIKYNHQKYDTIIP